MGNFETTALYLPSSLPVHRICGRDHEGGSAGPANFRNLISVSRMSANWDATLVANNRLPRACLIGAPMASISRSALGAVYSIGTSALKGLANANVHRSSWIRDVSLFRDFVFIGRLHRSRHWWLYNWTPRGLPRRLRRSHAVRTKGCQAVPRPKCKVVQLSVARLGARETELRDGIG